MVSTEPTSPMISKYPMRSWQSAHGRSTPTDAGAENRLQRSGWAGVVYDGFAGQGMGPLAFAPRHSSRP
jgi:hypothetical protein